ncbi:hypothetical protein WN48_03459 [Eufriesea mexicana]|nr:hypothetical protein WN48_03459 [Eufriesea mexicana]
MVAFSKSSSRDKCISPLVSSLHWFAGDEKHEAHDRTGRARGRGAGTKGKGRWKACKNVRETRIEDDDVSEDRPKGLTALGDAPKRFKREQDGGASLASRNWHQSRSSNEFENRIDSTFNHCNKRTWRKTIVPRAICCSPVCPLVTNVTRLRIVSLKGT